ncbi:hypothetical protein L596_025173 [Steinernema carpocapsae]|uniref:Peptidase S1 domain-containing protein n=1 Tax=Steinernema carpocapsae TaxID=34508 RepID=A0A4U5M7V7_STECR|nr:hypothetical protein L596_025173 [Steinernema carpocapsae]
MKSDRKTVGESRSFRFVAYIATGRCAGSPLNQRFVLAAAHCVTRGDVSKVYLGLLDKGNLFQVDVQIRKVKSSFVHPAYFDTIPDRDDIAVFELDNPVQYTRSDGFIEIYENDEPLIDGTERPIFSGYGDNDFDKEGHYIKTTNELLFTEVDFSDPKLGRSMFPESARGKLMCAEAREKGRKAEDLFL